MATSFAWIEPLGTRPTEVEAKLSAMNSELCASEAERKREFCGGAADDVIYVSMIDIEENELVLERDMKVRFRIYQGRHSVGACKVTSMSSLKLMA